MALIPTLMEPKAVLAAVLLGLLVQAVFSALRSYRLRAKMPPGPRGVPILGNLLQLSKHQWLRYAEWKDQYGPIFSLNLAGQPVIVVSDFVTAADLVDRRSAIYSSRPWFIMSCEILTGGLFFGLLPYGSKWRKMRRAAHEHFVDRAACAYESCQERESAVLLSYMLRDPEDWDNHLMRSAASAVLSAVYGRRPLDTNEDPIVTRINDITHRIGGGIPSLPGASLVQFFPWMRHLPEFLAEWKRVGSEWYRRDTELLENFLRGARNSVEKTASRSSFAAGLIENEQKYGLNDKEAAWVAGAMVAAGTEPMAGIFIAFMLAMTLYPDVQRRAQAQIDDVVGRGRMPKFSDRTRLPYVEAIVKEVVRWRPIDPLGVPRQSTEDDWYKGYFIPKGTVLIYNIWSMNRDPKYFPDCEEFRPERYLDASGELADSIPDTHSQGHFSFGAGRRMCPGKDFANQGFFIVFATMLWAFDIMPPLDAGGKPVLPSRTDCVDEGIVVRPAPFKCMLKPRLPDVRAVVESAISESVVE